MKKTLLLLILLTSSLFSRQSPPSVESIFFNSEHVIQIILSDGTKWKAQWSMEYEYILDEWEKWDEIYFYTKGNQEGVKLFNYQKDSYIYAFLERESFKLLPSLEGVNEDRGWFSSEYFVLFSDGSIFNYQHSSLPSRWKKGDKVIFSSSPGQSNKGRIINLGLQEEHILVHQQYLIPSPFESPQFPIYPDYGVYGAYYVNDRQVYVWW